MRDETYWENEGWRVLCNQTINLCLKHSAELFEAIDNGADTMPAQVERYVERILQALSARAKHDVSGLWPVALSLFGDIEGLQLRLLKDAALQPRPAGATESSADGAVSLSQALAQKLRDYLNDMKRAVHPHRLNVWTRLDRISRSVFATQHESRQSGRCSPEHFQALIRAIRERYPNDHNLPRTYDTIESYFLEFCKECQTRFIDHELMTADDVTVLIQDIDMDLQGSLHACLESLRREQQAVFDLIDVAFRLGQDNRQSKEDYRKSQGLSKRQLEQQQQLGIALLRDCLERKAVEA